VCLLGESWTTCGVPQRGGGVRTGTRAGRGGFWAWRCPAGHGEQRLRSLTIGREEAAKRSIGRYLAALSGPGRPAPRARDG
jgi:hypothetical protein